MKKKHTRSQDTMTDLHTILVQQNAIFSTSLHYNTYNLFIRVVKTLTIVHLLANNYNNYIIIVYYYIIINIIIIMQRMSNIKLVIGSWNIQLHAYVYKCSCKQCHVVLTTRFDDISFKIKHKLYIALGSAPPPPPPHKEKFWVRTWWR
jgi:hypothetical protein